MKLADFPPPFVEALCVHEALARLGFSLEKVFFMANNAFPPMGSRAPECAVVLLDRGLQFMVTVGHIPGRPRADIEAQWTQFATLASQGAFEDGFHEVFAASNVARNALPFIMALNERGFEVSLVAGMALTDMVAMPPPARIKSDVN